MVAYDATHLIPAVLVTVAALILVLTGLGLTVAVRAALRPFPPEPGVFIPLRPQSPKRALSPDTRAAGNAVFAPTLPDTPQGIEVRDGPRCWTCGRSKKLCARAPCRP